MTFEEWQATRQRIEDGSDYGHDGAVYIYDCGNILIVPPRDGDPEQYEVIISNCIDEISPDLAVVERILWDEWVKGETAEVDTKPHGIDRAAPVMVDAGEQRRMTWGQFIDANADAIEAGDVDPSTIAKDLLKRPGCTAFGGGGASAQWSIRLLVDEEARS